MYRIHAKPDKDRISELAIFLKALGFDLKNKDGEVTSKDINALLALLNATVTTVGILSRSRSQGAGLRKVQLFEYRSAMAPDHAVFDERSLRRLAELGGRLASGHEPGALFQKIDELVASSLSAAELQPRWLKETLTGYLGS